MKDASARPTRLNMEKAFRDLAAKAQKGDVIVIFLAGHGNQQTPGQKTVKLIATLTPIDVTLLEQ